MAAVGQKDPIAGVHGADQVIAETDEYDNCVTGAARQKGERLGAH